jgi:hypothetical protein
MSKLNSRFRYMYDAAPAAALLPKDGVAKTASFDGPTITLDKLNGFWNVPSIAADTVFPVAINVTALDKTTGDETYTLELEFGTAGFAQTVRTHVLAVKATGQLVALVDIDTVTALLGARPAVLRLKGTLAGTTPSITAHAFLAGNIKGQ